MAPNVEAVDLSGWEAIITKIAEDLHAGKIKTTDLNKNYILKTGGELTKAVKEGFGTSYKDTDEVLTSIRLQQNAWLFSAAKNISMQFEMATLMQDANGKLRSFNDFKQDVLKLNADYNVTYLQAEYQTVLASSQAAKKWQDIQRRKERYPNLIYKTVGDDLVSEEHAALEGIIRPINHSFWEIYYPPNRFRCRCYTIQTDKEPNGDDVPEVNEKNVPKIFRENLAISNPKVLPSKHPYFERMRSLIVKNENFLKRNLTDDMIKQIPFEEVYKLDNDSKILVHPFTDDEDFKKNIFSALQIAKAEKNAEVKLMWHLHDGKNPELMYNSIIGDRVECISIKSVDNTFRGQNGKYGKKGQLKPYNKSFAVFDFSNNSFNEEELAALIYGKMNLVSRNAFNFILYKNKAYKVDKTMGRLRIEKLLKK